MNLTTKHQGTCFSINVAKYEFSDLYIFSFIQFCIGLWYVCWTFPVRSQDQSDKMMQLKFVAVVNADQMTLYMAVLPND